MADNQTPFAELPAALVEEVLGQTSMVGDLLLETLRQVKADRATHRQALLDRGLIRHESTLGYPPLPTTCGADGSYAIERLLTIDPQGEFSKDMRRGGSGGEFVLPVGDLARKLGKESVVLTVRNLVLDTWALFEQILYESLFFERLTIPQGENRQLACSILVDKLYRAGVKLKDLHQRDSFDKAWKLLGDDKVQKIFYRSEASRGPIRYHAT